MLRKIRQKKTNTICFHLYVESKEQNKPRNKSETDLDTESGLVVARPEGWVGELGERSEGTEKCRLTVTEQSRGCKAQHREYSQ